MALGDNLVAIALIAIVAFTAGYMIAQSGFQGQIDQLSGELKMTQSTAAGLASQTTNLTTTSENCFMQLSACQDAMNSPSLQEES